MQFWYRYRIVTFTVALWIGGAIGTAINARFFGTTLPIYMDVAWNWGALAARLTIFGGACIALLGALVRLWGSSYLGGASVWSTTPHTQAFVTAGPFAWVRNPLYLGNFLIILGFFANATPLGLLGSIIGLAVAQHYAVITEERMLLIAHEHDFRSYEQSVARWIPRIPQHASSPITPSLRLGFLAEIYTFGIVLALFLWALGPPSHGRLPLLALLLGIVAQIAVNVRRRAIEPTIRPRLGPEFISDGNHSPGYCQAEQCEETNRS